MFIIPSISVLRISRLYKYIICLTVSHAKVRPKNIEENLIALPRRTATVPFYWAGIFPTSISPADLDSSSRWPRTRQKHRSSSRMLRTLFINSSRILCIWRMFSIVFPGLTYALKLLGKHSCAWHASIIRSVLVFFFVSGSISSSIYPSKNCPSWSPRVSSLRITTRVSVVDIFFGTSPPSAFSHSQLLRT